MGQEYERQKMYPLRLCPSIRNQAANIAHDKGISLNYFISLAIAEKLARLEYTLSGSTVQTADQAGKAQAGRPQMDVSLSYRQPLLTH